MRNDNLILNCVQSTDVRRATQPSRARLGWNGVVAGSGHALPWQQHIAPLGDAVATGFGLCHAGNGGDRPIGASAVWGA